MNMCRLSSRGTGTFLAAVMLIGATSPAWAQRQPTAAAGNLSADATSEKIERASCVLMLRTPPRYIGMNVSTATMGGMADLSALTTAMTTTGLIDPAAKLALGLGPREWPKVVRIEIAQAGPQAVKLSVAVDSAPNDLKQAEPATALMHQLVDRAKAVVSQSFEPRHEEAKVRLAEIEKRRADLRKSIEALRKRVREGEALTFRSGNGPGSQIAQKRRQLETELAAKKPTLKAIEEILPEVTSQTEELSKALKSLVAAKEALVAGLEKAIEQKKAEPLELLRARAELAEARVRAAEGGRNAFPWTSRSFPDEKLSLKIEISSLESQLKALPDPGADPAGPSNEEIQQLRSDLGREENELAMLEQQYQQARREFEAMASPPTLVLLDGQSNK